LLRALDAAPERAGAPNQPRRSGAAALRQVIERQRRRDRVSDWFAVACLALAGACADPAALPGDAVQDTEVGADDSQDLGSVHADTDIPCIPDCTSAECGGGGCAGDPDACGTCPESAPICSVGHCSSAAPPNVFGQAIWDLSILAP
jgi:hypothetical protein